MDPVTQTPFSKLPFELLARIFSECLPQYPLTEAQPNPNIAPMLLCHVCSAWRAVALKCPTLWFHLYIKLPISWNQQGDPVAWSSRHFIDDMNFILWWRQNQGLTPPRLRLGIRQKKPSQRLYRYHQLDLDGDNEAFRFLLEYMSSAQYLDADLLYRYLTVQAFNNGFDISCPNLHTLKTEYSAVVPRRYSTIQHDEVDDEEFMEIFGDMFQVPLLIPATVRRLSLFNNDNEITWTNNLDNWSTLTHLSLNVQCLVSDWHLISRVVTSLQWAYVCIVLSDEDITNYIEPPEYSLPTLSNLFLYFGSSYNEFLEFPLRALLHNLQLPALQDLHLSSEGISWWDTRASIDILNAIKSTPALRKLTLGPQVLAFPPRIDTPGVPDPVSFYIPSSLVHLQLQIFCPSFEEAPLLAERFIDEVFLSRQWMDLEGPSNSIRQITILIEQANDPIPIERILENLLKAAITERAHKAPKVSFKIVTQVGPGELTLLDETLDTWTVDSYVGN